MKTFWLLLALVLAGCGERLPPRYAQGEIVCLRLDQQMVMVVEPNAMEEGYRIRLSSTGFAVHVDEFELEPCKAFTSIP